MPATSPLSSALPFASAQVLRQRHGRLSLLRLSIYGLVSLGSHLLLLGLFRWAWQVQLAVQPVGSPIEIDFVEVDWSDGELARQIPDPSLGSSGEKLNAAQLNELIARENALGAAASAGNDAALNADANADSSALTQLDTGEPVTSTETAQSDAAAPGRPSPVVEDGTNRSWWPFGQPPKNSPQENSQGGLLGQGLLGGNTAGDRPSPSLASQPDSPNQTGAGETNPAGSSSQSNSDAIAPGNAGQTASSPNLNNEEDNSVSSNSNPSATVGAERPNSSNDDLSSSSPASTTDADGEGSEEGNGETETETGETAQSDGSAQPSGDNLPSSSTGRPNALPPNISDRPIAPNQTLPPDASSPEVGTEDDGSGNSPASDSDAGNGTVNGDSLDGAANGSETPTTSGDSPESAPSSSTTNTNANTESSNTDSSTTDPVIRLGANLVVDEVQSRALNDKNDVFTRLPRPLGDPLANGGPGPGRCNAQLAQLTLAHYGQPVQLNLAVDVTGEVINVEAVDAGQGQTVLGQAVACLVQAWPFEPAQRVLEEGGVEKIEDTGAFLFVTVSISRLE